MFWLSRKIISTSLSIYKYKHTCILCINNNINNHKNKKNNNNKKIIITSKTSDLKLNKIQSENGVSTLLRRLPYRLSI